jgi:hypothetical protein
MNLETLIIEIEMLFSVLEILTEKVAFAPELQIHIVVAGNCSVAMLVPMKIYN